MQKVLSIFIISALTINGAFAQTHFTNFSSSLYESDVKKLENYFGITPASTESMDGRLFDLENIAKTKLNYMPPSGDVPLRISSLSQKVFGAFEPPSESRIKDALAASQPKPKAHKLHFPKFQWASSQYGGTYGAPRYGPGGYAGPAAYGLPAPMPGTGTVWGSPQPFISQPLMTPGGCAGLINTMPGGGTTFVPIQPGLLTR